MENIINYLKETYRPTTIIVCGAYAEGTQNADSSFEALIFGPTCPTHRDDSVVDGVKLDVFVYPRDIFFGEIVVDEFIQVLDGRVVLEADGMGTWLIKRIKETVDAMPRKEPEEVENAIGWCEGMCERAAQGDTEAFFCWHWLLIDSLEVYCDACGKPFLGPKKAISDMKKHDPEAKEIYDKALSSLAIEALEAWVKLLRKRFEAE